MKMNYVPLNFLF